MSVRAPAAVVSRDLRSVRLEQVLRAKWKDEGPRHPAGRAAPLARQPRGDRRAGRAAVRPAPEGAARAPGADEPHGVQRRTVVHAGLADCEPCGSAARHGCRHGRGHAAAHVGLPTQPRNSRLRTSSLARSTSPASPADSALNAPRSSRTALHRTKRRARARLGRGYPTDGTTLARRAAAARTVARPRTTFARIWNRTARATHSRATTRSPR